MATTWDTPLYAAMIESDSSFRMLGGPFDDIDDALDCFWDNCVEHDLPRENLVLIEAGGDMPKIARLPIQALPLPQCDHPHLS